MNKGVDYYQVMNLPRDASPEEIREAYFDAARRLHPDANPDPEAREEFLSIQIAYEVLSNPQRRSAYDGTLPQQLVKPEISVNVKFSRSVLPRIEEPLLVYALLELVCTADLDRSKLPPVHICLALDRSTSMQGDRMDMVKAASAQLLRQLNPKDIVSIVAFGDRAEVVVPPTPVKELGKLEHIISLIKTSGGTEIYQGLEAGITQLQIKAGKNTFRHLILLTDGHTYGDEDACLTLAENAASEGIGISALGIGHEWNDSFLDKLTSYGGGNAVFVSSPRDLYKFLEQKLSAMEVIYARGISYDFFSDPGVQLRYAFRLYPETSLIPVTTPLCLGNIQYGKSLVALLEFMVNPLAKEAEQIKLSEGRVKMDIPTEVSPIERIFIKLKRTVSDSSELELPAAAIVEAMSRLTLYRLQERARLEVEAGSIQSATKHLQYLATHLLAEGDRELAHTVLVEAEHIQQSQHFSKDGDKRIKYGTRALLLPSGLEGGKP
jgi:Ca-activated chloride channel family protein